MRLFAFLVAILVGGAFVAGPALAHARGRALGGSPTPMTVTPGVGRSLTGGIPGTLGGTSNAAGSTMTGGISGTLGGTRFDSGGSTTSTIGSPWTLGTGTTGSTDLLGNSVFGGSTGAAH